MKMLENIGQLEQMQLAIKILQEEVQLLKNQHTKNDFSIVGNKKAMKILNCSEPTLRKARLDGRLVQGEDFKSNGSLYTYSKSSLHNKRGEI
jgi:hypothetical protein